PLWSPDGRWITFGVEDRGALALYRVGCGADGAPAAPPAAIVTGERVVNGVSLSADGRRLAFTATDALTPTEVFACGPDGGGERRLTDENRAWRASVSLAAPERFRFERAGFTVDGWVMKPV